MDKTIMYWENKGKLVPTRDLIKTPEQIEGIRKAGVVNTGAELRGVPDVSMYLHQRGRVSWYSQGGGRAGGG